jgi:hypothetical protein
MNADEIVLVDLMDRMIGNVLTVSHALGAGFLEQVDENALAHELRKAGLAVVQQHDNQTHPPGTMRGNLIRVHLRPNHLFLNGNSSRRAAIGRVGSKENASDHTIGIEHFA